MTEQTHHDHAVRRGPEPFTLDGVYALDEDRRIARSKARLEHAEAALAFGQRGLVAGRREIARAYEELARLRPHWGAGVTKEQAVAAYRAANPDGDQYDEERAMARVVAEGYGIDPTLPWEELRDRLEEASGNGWWETCAALVNGMNYPVRSPEDYRLCNGKAS